MGRSTSLLERFLMKQLTAYPAGTFYSELDEAQFAAWVKQASQFAGRKSRFGGQLGQVTADFNVQGRSWRNGVNNDPFHQRPEPSG